MDRFQEMRVFAAVVDAGSFVGASEALAMSKAAVSRIVSDLELRLGVRVLHRTTRRIALTAEGDVFLARCRELLTAVEDAEAEISARSGQVVGTLKVSAPVSFGVLRLAPLWGGFLGAHPGLQLEVNLSDRFVDLVDEGIDLAVRIARMENSSIVSRTLSTTRMILCASPRYIRDRGRPRHPAELAGHTVLAYSLFAVGNTWEFQGPEGSVSVNVKPRMHTNSGDTCRAAALAHQGIILQPSFLVGDDVAAGTLVELMPQYRSHELGIHAVYPTRKHLPNKVRLLIDYLALALAGSGTADPSTTAGSGKSPARQRKRA